MTLIELLVVLVIVLLLAAATIPRLRPEIDRSRIREAARSIQLYLSTARNQAIATGHSCGVMIERLAAQPGCSMALTQVETPPLYGGDTTAAFATVTLTQNTGTYAYCKIALFSAPNTPLSTSFALHVGDMVQVGYQGFWINLVTQGAGSGGAIPAGTSQLTGRVDISHGELPPWTVQPISGPFNIIRMPTKSAASALQLPSPAAIDLTWSGFDQEASNPVPTWGVYDNNPVIIMFAPNGSVDKVYVTSSSGFSWVRVTSAVYLLVGRRDEVDNPANTAAAPPWSYPGAAATDAACNVYDLTSLWVSVNASTGLIVVTDNAQCTPAPPAGPATYSVGNVSTTCMQARTFARQQDAMGGK
jgi:type II secretory pathway pseudopilin PulG